MAIILRSLFVFLLLAGVLGGSDGALAARRVALVIGNDSYPALGPDGQLQTAVNDAEAVGDALAGLGYEVIRGDNLGRSALLQKVDTLVRRLEPGDSAFVFFAGHGLSIDGANYLLPADVPADQSENLTKLSAIAEQLIETQLRQAGVRDGVIVLDACRNNPFRQAGVRALAETRGLTRVEPPAGIFKLYSAGTGEVALDRLGDDDPNPNSVFTRILLGEMSRQGESLVDVAYAVKEKVATLAATVGHDQHPAHYDGGFANRIFLAAPPAEVAVHPYAKEATAPRPTPAGGQTCENAAAHFEAARRIGTAEALKLHVIRFHDCAFAELAAAMIDEMAAVPAAPLAVTSAADAERVAFEAAIASGDSAALTAFLVRFPEGPHASAAKKTLKAREIEEALWIEANAEDTDALYALYLERFPNGRYAALARSSRLRLADEADWTAALASRSLAAFETYIAKRPEGLYATEARRHLGVLETRALQHAPRNADGY